MKIAFLALLLALGLLYALSVGASFGGDVRMNLAGPIAEEPGAKTHLTTHETTTRPLGAQPGLIPVPSGTFHGPTGQPTINGPSGPPPNE